MMIKLYSFGPNFGMVDPSPFVLKIDAYMRIANIEFESIADLGNLKKAPKGKLPFIKDGDKSIADSEFIIAYLEDKYQLDLDAHLTHEQQSQAYLLGKSLDENLYWCLVYSRWARPDTWAHVKRAFFGSMPFPLNIMIPPLARRAVMSALYKQGLGRHSDEEIKIIADRSFKALSQILADKCYFFGTAPCTFDATAYGFLSQFILVELEDEFIEMARHYDNLVDYCENMQARFYNA